MSSGDVATANSFRRVPAAVSPTAPALANNVGDDILIRHPGYTTATPLFALKGFDCVENVTGIHHGTVLTACAIVSGNKDGYLSRTKDGQELGLPLDGIVKAGIYFYIVHGNLQYPVYPCFQFWKFPHNTLPRGWTASPTPRTQRGAVVKSLISKAVLDRDHGCILSRAEDLVEKAHLCPESETAWFRRNDMVNYNCSFTDMATDDMSNLVALRKDIHAGFDQRRMFVLTPKQDRWLVHFLEPTKTLGPLYHNMEPELSDDIAPEHLLTRFAWAIFPLIKVFLQAGGKRRIQYAINDNDGEIQDEDLTGDEISKIFFQSKSKTESPTKRNRSNTEQPGMADVVNGVRGSQRQKIWNSQDTSSGNPPSLSTAKSSTRSISITTARINPITSLPEEGILEYDCGDDGIEDPDPRVHRLYSYESPLDRLRRFELERRRPYDKPTLFCCDYDQRKEVIHAAIKEEGEWDAYALCDECLGGEYRLRAQDLDEYKDEEDPDSMVEVSDDYQLEELGYSVDWGQILASKTTIPEDDTSANSRISLLTGRILTA
ncbi:MAG: hypothetical protein Q9184_006933 [Pyrenodesmia sp. 2 TL-2023]